jgi:hypothetical protein
MNTTSTSSTSTGNVRILLVLLNGDMPVSPDAIPSYPVTINRSRRSANTVARGSVGVVAAADVVVMGGRGTVFGSALGHYCYCHCCYCQSLTATPSILANSIWKARGVREWRVGVKLTCAEN